MTSIQEPSPEISIVGHIGTFLLFFVIFYMIMQFIVRMGMAQFHNELLRYELTVRPPLIMMKLAQSGEIVIRREQVSKIEQIRRGDLIVRSIESQQSILIPAQIDGFEEVKAHLAEWRTIEASSSRFDLCLLVLALVCGVLVFVGSRLVNPLATSLVMLIACAGIGGVSYRVFRRTDIPLMVKFLWLFLAMFMFVSMFRHLIAIIV